MFRKHLTLFPWGKKTKLLHHDPNKSHMKNGLTYMTDVRGGGERAKKLIKTECIYLCLRLWTLHFLQSSHKHTHPFHFLHSPSLSWLAQSDSLDDFSCQSKCALSHHSCTCLSPPQHSLCPHLLCWLLFPQTFSSSLLFCLNLLLSILQTHLVSIHCLTSSFLATQTSYPCGRRGWKWEWYNWLSGKAHALMDDVLI